MERLVAVDVGYGQLKAKADRGELCVPSYIAEDVGPVSRIGRLQGEVEIAVTDDAGRWWLVGREAVDQSLTPLYSALSDRTADAVFRVLLRAALAYLSEGDCDVNLVTGLPPAQQMDALQRQDFATSLRGTYRIECRVNDRQGSVTVTVCQARIPPQAIGTFYDLILDAKGEPRPEIIDTPLYYGDKLIIDVGGGTTDLLGVSGLKPLSPVTRTIRQGMNWVYGEISRRYRQLPVARIERMVLDDELDPSEQVRQLASVITAEAQNLLDLTGYDPQTIIITGGPAQLIRPYINAGRAEVIVCDEMANVRGYYKWGSRAKTFANSSSV